MSSHKHRRSRSHKPPAADGIMPQDIPYAPPVSAPAPQPAAATQPRQTTLELERIGDILRRVRERQGESIDSIAATLCIRPNFLVALENSHYEELPADAYVIGFLRSYANHLGLDGKGAIDQYRREMAGRRRKPQLSLPQPITEGRAPTAVILIGGTLAALLVYALWYALATSDRAAVTTPPPLPTVTSDSATTTDTAVSTPAITTPAPTPAAPASAPASAPATVAPTTSPPVVTPPPSPPAPTVAVPSLPKGQVYGDQSTSSRVTIRCEKESWILIADKNGATIFDHILKPGDVYGVPNAKGLTLTTGNGGGIIMTLDGAALPRFSPDTRVLRNVSLDPEQLRATATR